MSQSEEQMALVGNDEVESDHEILPAESDSASTEAVNETKAKVQAAGPVKFGTFSGVFRPTMLTILGVIMYLREGWLIGNAGLLGGILVIFCCYLITGLTALSLSSITTNIRVGSGGVFSIISQSLGLEVGGSVGIPLFLAQGLSAALYLQGIVETWAFLFPQHSSYLVMVAVFSVAIAAAYFGAKFVFRIQSLVMATLVLALISMFMGLSQGELQESPRLWGDFTDGSFWLLFAVFFPASTGIMVGSSMSGSLKRPRRSIPVGTMAAWIVTLVIYLVMAVWYAYLGDPVQLRDTDAIFSAQYSFVPWLVLLGILASCFSATLSSLVAAPRVLQALSEHRIVPFYRVFQRLHRGEPRNATILTGAMVLAVLFIGDLNAIAKVLTMFFLVIYFMINLVLFIEHRLRMISFRPQLELQSWVPILGTISCFTAIIIINPVMGLIAIGFILGIYFYLDNKHLQTPWETVHSGLFVSIANWAAKKVILQPVRSVKRSWKPDLLIPVKRTTQLEGYFRIVRALIYPQGTIHVIRLTPYADRRDQTVSESLLADFRRDKLFATSSIMEGNDYMGCLRSSISVMRGAFFRPNTIFVSIEDHSQEELRQTIALAKRHRMGVIFLAIHPESRMGRERTVNLWVRDQSPNWKLGLKLANLDYSVLLSYQLKKNWQAHMRVLCVVRCEEDQTSTRTFLNDLMRSARMPKDVEIRVSNGEFWEEIDQEPGADIHIMGLAEDVDKAQLEKLVERTRGTCLFVLDSGNESALA